MNGISELLLRMSSRRRGRNPVQIDEDIWYGGKLPMLGTPRIASYQNPAEFQGLLSIFSALRNRYRLPPYWGGQS